MATNYDRYVERMRKIADIGHSIAVLSWDKETYLPKKVHLSDLNKLLPYQV